MSIGTVKMIIRKSILSGEINAPPSKSYTHRAIICASLANGTSTIENPLISDDTKATITACEALGAEILEKNYERLVIRGTGGRIKAKNAVIDCGESGSTLRFMIPLAALAGSEIVFKGKRSLAERPTNDLLDALTPLGVRSEYSSWDKTLPVRISGPGKMSGGKIRIRGDVSSQFITGLLFALPLAESDSEITITTDPESKEYINITLDMLEKFGISIDRSIDLTKYKIKGTQRYNAQNYSVEGDYSSASFMLVGGAIASAAGGITVNNLNPDSRQGDKRIIDILKSMGAGIEIKEDSVAIVKSDLRGTTFDAKDMPDLVPILAVAAMQASSKTIIKNVDRLKIKESDRLAGVLGIARALSGTIESKDNSIAISGKDQLRGAEVETLGDHRLVMAASIAGLVAKGETIVCDPIAIKKSYPDFFDDLRKLGGDTMAMSSAMGNTLKVTLIGESHGMRIGTIIEGVPKGIELDSDFIQSELEKRRSISSLTTPRKETDIVKIMSGLDDGKTNGAAIRLEIENKDVKSEIYEKMKDLPRPGHADYTAREKYASVFDYRGGGFLSGRMTACYVAAGAVAKKVIGLYGVKVLADTIQIGDVRVDRELSDEEIEKNTYSNLVRCADLEKAKEMELAVEKARREGDSLGGIVECRILKMPIGVGEPVFYSIESVISQAMFTIPAVKGVEFGSGFKAASMKGSEHNDPMKIENGRAVTLTNNAGGMQGGLSNGMPITFRIAIKPTSSIPREQDTIDVRKMKNAKIKVLGRHDPCIAIRAPPIVEAMASISIADLLLSGGFMA